MKSINSTNSEDSLLIPTKSTAGQMPTVTSTAASMSVLAAAATASRDASIRTWGFLATLITFATLLVEKLSELLFAGRGWFLFLENTKTLAGVEPGWW